MAAWSLFWPSGNWLLMLSIPTSLSTWFPFHPPAPWLPRCAASSCPCQHRRDRAEPSETAPDWGGEAAVTPKGSQIDPKVIPKWPQSDPKVVPKWDQVKTLQESSARVNVQPKAAQETPNFSSCSGLCFNIKTAMCKFFWHKIPLCMA